MVDYYDLLFLDYPEELPFYFSNYKRHTATQAVALSLNLILYLAFQTTKEILLLSK